MMQELWKLENPAVAGSRTQDTSCLSRQCFATEPQQLDNYQPSQSFICTAQVVLNASTAHLAATQYVPGLIGKFSPSGKNPLMLSGSFTLL